MSINFHWMQRNHWPCDNAGLIQMSKELEGANISSVLLPYGPGGHDFLLHIPDIFRNTKKIRMMVAVGAYAVTPEYLFRSFHYAQEFAKDRLDLNLVAGRYSDEFAKMAIDSYPGDSNLIDTHEKRVEITEKWMSKFVDLIKDKDYKIRLAVVGSSDTTINIANSCTDYIIINGWMLGEGYMNKIINPKPILVLDPLVLEPGQNESDVKYHDYKFSTKYEHPIKGTIEEVAEEIKNFSRGYNINDFMIHTDQVDITNLLKLVKYMTEDTNG